MTGSQAQPALIEARPEAAVATDERIRADLAQLLQNRLVRESRLGVWVHPFLIAVIVALAWPAAPHPLLVAWAAAVALTATLRGAWLYVAARGTLNERSVRTGVRLTVTLLAMAWGVGGALVLPLVPFETTALILVVLAGIIASALTTLAADPLSLRGFLAGIALPVFVALATSERTHDLAAAVVVAIFTLGMAIVARRAHITLVEHLQITARLAVSEGAAKRAEAVMRDARDLAERVARAPTTPTTPTTPAAAAPPVDLEGFRTTLREAGAEQALYSIIDTFVRQGPERLAALAAAAASGDGPEIAKAAHVFRGAAATIGARELAALLERVETTARAGRIDAAREAFALVSPVAHHVTEYLRQQRASLPEE